MLLKLFVIRLEDKPRAFYWKIVKKFATINELNDYCKQNNITDLKVDDYAVENKIEYVD